MKRKTVCPNCTSSFLVPEQYEGKKAKCAKCNQSFVVAFPNESINAPAWPSDELVEQITPEIRPSSLSNPLALTPPQVRTQIIDVPAQKPAIEKLKKYGPIIATLLVGFFLGREHVKYQMRSAMSDVASAFEKAINDTASEATVRQKNSELPNEDSISMNLQASQPATIAPDSTLLSAEPVVASQPPLATQQTILDIGQPHSTDRFSIALTSASIEKAKISGLMNDISLGKDADLILQFSITNTNDRRILRFDEGNQFMPSHFRLRDDVDNVIRGVDYGFGNKVVGALTGNEDITPGMTVNHIELFSVPPPKTEFLILSVDLECVGGEGLIEYRIPVNQIRR
jgi:predicted Zn finger-like uncharacterized protein